MVRDAENGGGAGKPVPSAPGGPVVGTVHVIAGTGRTRIILSGEIDSDMAEELEEARAEAEKSGLPIEVDTHHVTFMDSSGITFLARLSTSRPDRIRLLRVPPTVEFLLEVTRIGELFDVVEDSEIDHESGPDEQSAPAAEPAPAPATTD